MNNVVNGNAIEAVANVFAGKNGPVLGGILGILGLVGIHYLVNGNYRLAGTGQSMVVLLLSRQQMRQHLK